jgi:hypothetical protein
MTESLDDNEGGLSPLYVIFIHARRHDKDVNYRVAVVGKLVNPEWKRLASRRQCRGAKVVGGRYDVEAIRVIKVQSL